MLREWILQSDPCLAPPQGWKGKSEQIRGTFATAEYKPQRGCRTLCGGRVPPEGGSSPYGNALGVDFREPVKTVSKCYYKEALWMLTWRASLQRAGQPRYGAVALPSLAVSKPGESPLLIDKTLGLKGQSRNGGSARAGEK